MRRVEFGAQSCCAIVPRYRRADARSGYLFFRLNTEKVLGRSRIIAQYDFY